MPDVTEAHLAEAGGPVRKRPARNVPVAARAAADDPDAHESPPAGPRKGLFGRTTDFLRASCQELRRVQWPDRRQVGQGTAVTLGFVIVAGAYLAARRHLESRHPGHSLEWPPALKAPMFRWYVINTYSGHENKVKQNLEHRVSP